MNMRVVTFKLPEPMIAGALRLAQARDSTLGQIVRDALSAEIRRCSRNATTPNRAEEQLLAPLRVLLASEFALAKTWQDLQARLQAQGYALREAGGGLALHTHPDGMRMCKASELGHAYASLMRRFNAPFPSHSHHHLVDKVLGPTRIYKTVTQQDDTDGFDVIEPL